MKSLAEKGPLPHPSQGLRGETGAAWARRRRAAAAASALEAWQGRGGHGARRNDAAFHGKYTK